MIPGLIQHQLQDFYDLNLGYHVDDFLITDRILADALDCGPKAKSIDEKLLVLEEPDGLSISLYLSEQLLSNLQSNNPFIELNDANLGEFCTALEGVSHFLYLGWNATHDRPISQLELELQAEVDKFVSILLLCSDQGNEIEWSDLIEKLFAQCRFNPELDANELARYQRANDCASSFCSQLDMRNVGRIDTGEAITELRRFYRTRHHDKISRCNATDTIQGP